MTSAPIAPSVVRALFSRGWDTLQIAKHVSRTEAEVYNALEPRLPPREFADAAHRNLIRRSAELNEDRRGKRAPVSQVQRSATARRSVPVTLPHVSILGNDDADQMDLEDYLQCE